MLKHDDIEDKIEYKEIFDNVNVQVKKILEEKGVKKQLGYIHIFDAYKKEILKKKYNIDWKTTKEMNPDIIID